jgi:hypothetical protein
MSSAALPTERPLKRTKRQPTYSDAQRAHALTCLKANGGNLLRTFKETGVTRRTLKQWRDADASAPRKVAADELAVLAEQTMTEVYEHGRRKAALLCIRDLEHIDAYKRGLLSAVFTDKVLLLNGQPTSITAHTQGGLTLSPDQVRAFQALLREMRAAPSPVTGTDATVTTPALAARTEPATVSTGADATAPAPPAPVEPQAPTHSDPRA